MRNIRNIICLPDKSYRFALKHKQFYSLNGEYHNRYFFMAAD